MVIIRPILSSKSTLLMSIILGCYFVYFDQTPNIAYLKYLIGIGFLILLTTLFFSFGNWESVFLVLAPIGISSFYLFNNPMAADPTIIFSRIIWLGFIIDLLSLFTRFNFRHPIFTSVFRSLPRTFFLIFGLASAGLIVFAIVSYLPVPGLIEHQITIAWILLSVLLFWIINPPALYFLVHQRVECNSYPLTLRLLVRTAFAYGLFITGCLILTGIGFLLFAMFPSVKKESIRKYFFHRIIRRFCRILVLATTRGLTIIDENNDPFNKPSIIIANHQSFIDLIVMLSLHPRLVLLTNDWVWHSPLFGRIVKWADYYPVSAGIESSIDDLKKIVANGFSIVVFPEGTRSKDMKIKRFKKGAFYLSERLKLDILPIMLHGTGEGITKKEFIFKKTSLTAFILPKIDYNSQQFARDYSNRSKQVTIYFRDKYSKLRTRRETPKYLSNRLKLSYTYQGFLPRSAVRHMNQKNQQLLPYLFDLPLRTGVLHIGCNYGEITCLLSQRFPEVPITGIEQDKSKLGIIRNTLVHLPGNRLNFGELEMLIDLNHPFDLCLLDTEQLLKTRKNRQDLIDACLNRLLPGGSVILFQKHQASTDPYRELLEAAGNLIPIHQKSVSSKKLHIYQKAL